MAAGKADYLSKRLATAGLSPDAISRYIETLRLFLTAKLTKIRFEDEMAKVLPREKYHVHNDIIRDLLKRAQKSREGLPDVPVIAPVREKRPAPHRKERPPSLSHKSSAPNTPNLPNLAKTEPVAATSLARQPNAKRKRDDYEHDTKPNGTANPAGLNSIRNKPKGGVQRKVSEKSDTDNNAGRFKPKLLLADKASPKRQKLNLDTATTDGNGSMGPPPANGSIGSGRSVPTVKNNLAVPVVDVPSYDSLVFQPVQPGKAMDVELFRRLRIRMRSCVDRMGVLGGVKDEAVALMTHSLEVHVKKLLEASVRERIARDCTRPSKFSRCEAVTTYDMREAVCRDLSLLGTDPSIVLERLAMLL